MPRGKFLDSDTLLALVGPGRTKQTHIVLLNNLLEASVVQLCIFGEVVHICYHVADFLFQQHEIVLCGRLDLRPMASLLKPLNDPGYFVVRLQYPPAYFLGLDVLERGDLVQLLLQLPNKALLVIFIPRPAGWVRISVGGKKFVGSLEALFEIVVGNVGMVVLSDQRGPELMAESVIIVWSEQIVSGC